MGSWLWPGHHRPSWRWHELVWSSGGDCVAPEICGKKPSGSRMWQEKWSLRRQKLRQVKRSHRWRVEIVVSCCWRIIWTKIWISENVKKWRELLGMKRKRIRLLRNQIWKDKLRTRLELWKIQDKILGNRTRWCIFEEESREALQKHICRGFLEVPKWDKHSFH